MPSAADIALFRQVQARLSGLAVRDLERFWAAQDLARPERVRDGLLEFVPVVTSLYGDAAATAAADWYDEVRAEEAIAGRYRAAPAEPFPEEFVQARVRYGARHLFTEDPAAIVPFLAGAVDEYVLQPGRDTVTKSALADPAAGGWHRETSGDACSFCRMLAGRGAVYRKGTAAFAAHANCGCVAVPSWNSDAPEVPAAAYVASERHGALRARAANGDRSAQRQLDENRRRVREHIAANY